MRAAAPTPRARGIAQGRLFQPRVEGIKIQRSPGAAQVDDELIRDIAAIGFVLGRRQRHVFEVDRCELPAAKRRASGPKISSRSNANALRLTGFSHEELTSLQAGRDLAGDERQPTSMRVSPAVAGCRGASLCAARMEGSSTNCRYWGAKTTVSSLPYFILTLACRGRRLD
jgi:hypothetical protein